MVYSDNYSTDLRQQNYKNKVTYVLIWSWQWVYLDSWS